MASESVHQGAPKKNGGKPPYSKTGSMSEAFRYGTGSGSDVSRTPVIEYRRSNVCVVSAGRYRCTIVTGTLPAPCLTGWNGPEITENYSYRWLRQV